MQAEFSAPVALIYSFLLVLARISGAMIFVPLPGIRSAPEPIRVVLILAMTMALYPVWPAVPAVPSVVEYMGWVSVEAVFGLCIGLLVGFFAEAALMFGQICGIHAGYSFASTIDPNSEADSPVLSALAQAMAGLLFVTFGLHRVVIRLFAESLQSEPPAKLLVHQRWGNIVIHSAGSIFSTGLRLALPVLALLMMVDLMLALLGRINSHLQLLQLAMPLKMLAALAAISALLVLFPAVFENYAERLFRAAFTIVR